jgi:hypothetical protein
MTILTNTQSLSLLNEVVGAVGESNTSGFLESVSSCLSERFGFEPAATFFQRAALSGDILSQDGAIELILSRPAVRYALAPHAESLARAVGLEDRIGDYQAAPFSPRDNPIPWWFAARYPQPASSKTGTSAAIPLVSGALAIGRTGALRWLLAYREVLETQRLPEGFSPEPYLLWIPDELAQTAFLNVTGGIVPEFGKEFQAVNEPGHLKIRALLPFLAPGDSFVVDRSEEMKRGPIFREWKEGRADAAQLAEFFERKYKTVRMGENPSVSPSLLPAQPAAWAFHAFQHQIRTPGSDTYAYANEAMKGLGEPWISYDLSSGFFLGPAVTGPWKEIPGLRVYLRGKSPRGIETGVYGPDVHILREGLPEGIVRFFEVLVETLQT